MDDRTRPDRSRLTDRPGPMMVMLWLVSAVMLLAVGVWVIG